MSRPQTTGKKFPTNPAKISHTRKVVNTAQPIKIATMPSDYHLHHSR
jgi:hypothetical protein